MHRLYASERERESATDRRIVCVCVGTRTVCERECGKSLQRLELPRTYLMARILRGEGRVKTLEYYCRVWVLLFFVKIIFRSRSKVSNHFNEFKLGGIVNHLIGVEFY